MDSPHCRQPHQMFGNVWRKLGGGSYWHLDLVDRSQNTAKHPTPLSPQHTQIAPNTASAPTKSSLASQCQVVNIEKPCLRAPTTSLRNRAIVPDASDDNLLFSVVMVFLVPG